MTLWDASNTQSNPCFSNMDGKNTRFNPETDCIDASLTVYGDEFLQKITDENTNISYLIAKDIKYKKDVYAIFKESHLKKPNFKFDAGVPPPPSSIPFEHVGEPVYCPNGDYNKVIATLGWTCWATHRENGHCWVVRQEGTDRYWVDEAEGGASVPGAGENVFFNDKATEDGNWNATTHWKASTGTATGDAYTATLDVNSAALGTINVTYASATLACGANTLEHDGAGTLSAGVVSLTTGKWQADGALDTGCTFGANNSWTFDCNANLTISGGSISLPNNSGQFTFGGSTWTHSSGTLNNDGGTVAFDYAGTTSLASNETSLNVATIGDAVTLAIVTYTLTCAGDFTVGTGTGGTVTFTTGTLNTTGILTISAAATLGSNTAYTLNSDGNFILAATGVCNAPTGAGSFTMAGGTFTTAGTFTNDSGNVVFDRAGVTTLGANCTSLYQIQINNGTTLDTSAASNYNLTANTTGDVNCCILNGTLACNASTVSLGNSSTYWGCSIGSTGNFTGGSATCTFGTLLVGASATFSQSSGNTTISSSYNQASDDSVSISATATYTDNSGTFIFTEGSDQSIANSNANNIYNLTVNAASCNLQLETNISLDGALSVTVGTLTTLDTDGSTSRNLTVAGTTTVGASGVLTGNASTLDFAAFTMVTTATFNSPTGAGAMTVAGNLTGTTTMTWTQNGVTTVLDGATQTLTGFSQNTATTVLGNLTIQTSTTLTVTGTNRAGTTVSNQTVVLTFNMAGAIADGGSGNLRLASNSAAPLICTSMPTSFARVDFEWGIRESCSFPASTWTNCGYFYPTFLVNSKTITQTGTVVINTTDYTEYSASGITGVIYAQAATSLTITSSTTILFGITSSSYITNHTVTTGTLNLTATSGISVIVGSTLGSNSNYVLDINSSFTNAGTTNLPNATGTCTFSGTTWTETAAVTANSGLVTFDKAGTTTLGSNATSFYKVTVSSGTTLDTSASNYSVTSGERFTVIGTFYANGSTLSFGSGVTGSYAGLLLGPASGVFRGSAAATAPTGAHTFATLYLYGSTTAYLTSNTTTINGNGTATATVVTGGAGTLAGHSSGTVNFTYAGTQLLYDSGNSTQTLYNVTLTKGAGNTLQYSNTYGYTLSVAGALTITSGTFSTVETVSGTSRNLTVTGSTSISGTLTCNASTVSLGSGLTTAYAVTLTGAGATFTGGSGAHTIGSMIVNSSTSCTLTSNTTTFNGWNTDGSKFVLIVSASATTFAHGSGTAHFDNSGNNTPFVTDGKGTGLNVVQVDYTTDTLRMGAALNIASTLTITTGTLSTGPSNYALSVTGATSITGTLTCNDSVVSAAAVTVNDGGLLSVMTADMGMTGNLIVGGGASGSVTFSAAGDLEIDGTTTINTGATLGSAVAYILNMDGNLVASTGTLVAPTGTGWTYAGAQFTSPTTLTAGAGTINFDLAGTTTLQNASIQFNNVAVKDGATLATSTYNFTAGGTLVVGDGASGVMSSTSGNLTVTGTTTISAGATFSPAADVCSFNSGVTAGATVGFDCVGTLTAPSGDWTVGSFYVNTGSTVTLTTGTTTINGAYTADNVALVFAAPTAFSASTGTVSFTYAGAQVIADLTNTARALYNLTVNKTGTNTLQFYNTYGFALTVSNNFTLTSGKVDTEETVSGTDKNFTVQGDSTIAGTLDGNASAISFKDLTISAGGTYTATSGTTTITGATSASNAWVNGGTFTNSSGKVDFTGESGTYHIEGDNTWYNLEISVAAACTYLFENGKTQSVTNTLTLTGAVSNLLTLDSVSGAATWTLTLTIGATQTVEYVNAKYSDAGAGAEILAANSVDSMFNINWMFFDADDSYVRDLTYVRDRIYVRDRDEYVRDL